MLKDMSGERTPEPLPDGIWDMVADGARGDLNIKVDRGTGELIGTVRWHAGEGGEPYTNNIFGFWDDIGWKITFLREHQGKFDSGRQLLSEQGHHRDQVYTGYMWKGTTTPPPPPYTHCLAGSFIAFGGSQGTGGKRYRSEFGWAATYPSSSSNMTRK
jgi:hypothetical protein